MVKFSSKMDAGVMEELRQHAAESGRSIASILNEAVGSYLEQARVRPAYREAATTVLETHSELLQRLAK